ncbi:MAG: hypothetical protein K6F09_05970 [Clostridiales bacterium]|nr:hypothetical protein [Clostridiales bacterium]
MTYNEAIIPYVGIESIKLYQKIDEIKTVLKTEGVSYREERWSSESETIPNPWIVLIIENIISLFFAKNEKLFKIVFWEGYRGSLPNGISLGTSIEDAKVMDPSLRFDDWNEIYQSDNGYWIEDDIDTKTVLSISVFIEELLDDDSFDYCNW